MMHLVHIATSTLFLLGIVSIGSALSEDERLKEYEARGYQWPIQKFVPNTPGWKTLLERRFEQVSETIDNRRDRYNAWIQLMPSALTQPNFTENG